MFNLFKKKPTFTSAMQELFVKISLALPDSYNYLHKQLTEGIIKDVKKPDGQMYQLRLDIPLLNKYEDRKGRNFLIENIVIGSVASGKSCVVSWDIAYGLLLAYFTDNNEFVQWQAEAVSIDTSRIRIKYLDDSPIEKLLSKKELQYIALNDLYEVSLNGKTYYHVQDITDGDGDFIGIDNDKNVYEFRHDPFEITLLTEPLETILKSNTALT
ncbi:MAG: hypothetical protein Q3983_09850 [Capnocytophaga sp.]|nr:hypothetical protein [Capnocytophaga sp.]